MFFSGLVLRIKIQKRWTSLTDYVDFCSILHGLQIAEYSLYLFKPIFDCLSNEKETKEMKKKKNALTFAWELL